MYILSTAITTKIGDYVSTKIASPEFFATYDEARAKMLTLLRRDRKIDEPITQGCFGAAGYYMGMYVAYSDRKESTINWQITPSLEFR